MDLFKKPNTIVYQGQQIGLVGSTGRNKDGKSSSTGPHLHFEIREDNIPIDPVKIHRGLLITKNILSYFFSPIQN